MKRAATAIMAINAFRKKAKQRKLEKKEEAAKGAGVGGTAGGLAGKVKPDVSPTLGPKHSPSIGAGGGPGTGVKLAEMMLGDNEDRIVGVYCGIAIVDGSRRYCDFECDF
jgi:hypothetical protein